MDKDNLRFWVGLAAAVSGVGLQITGAPHWVGWLVFGIGIALLLVPLLWHSLNRNAVTLPIDDLRAVPAPTVEDHRARWGKLRAQGVGLRNNGIQGFFPDSDWNQWASDVALWNAEVVKAIRPVSNADAEWFATLDEVPPPRFKMDSIFASEAHKHLHAMHDFRLRKLEKLIEEYRGKV